MTHVSKDEMRASPDAIVNIESSESSNTSSSPTKHVEENLMDPSETQLGATRLSASTTNSSFQEIRSHHSGIPLPLRSTSSPSLRPFAPCTKHHMERKFVAPVSSLRRYGIGIIAAMLSGFKKLARNVVYGHWTTGVTDKEAGRDELIASGSQAGWLLVVVGTITVLCGCTFLNLPLYL